MQIEPTPPSLDVYLDALGDVERRRLLLELLESAETESVVLDGFVEASDRNDLEIALKHVHLPKLTSAGLVECDEDESQAYRGPGFEDIVPILEYIAEYENH